MMFQNKEQFGYFMLCLAAVVAGYLLRVYC